MLKIELHSHTSDDPEDFIRHTARELIDRAAALAYDALAITLHNKQLDLRDLRGYGADRGITLVPGVEREINGKHVLLINFPAAAAEAVSTFDELARLKRESRGLVIAPHPFFPAGSCLWSELTRRADLFDAVEFHYLHTRLVNFNRRAVRWAQAHGKPLVATGDVHYLSQLGTTYTLVEAERDPDALCQAIREGRVQIRSSPISLRAAVSLFARMKLDELKGARFRALSQPTAP